MTSVVSDYTVVIAIDFGTARSGYYFQFTAGPGIYANNTWLGAPENGKTLTEVLLKQDESFVAFGYEARNKFASCEDKSNYLYFSNFKMTLHNKEGMVRSKVKANNCNVYISTQKLAAICLKAIKDRALAQTRSSKTVTIEDSRIRWVVTVPAIWDHAARQAMLNAAEEAGMAPSNVIIALEPEAAVLTCLEHEKKQGELSVDDTDFMVVDAGGGTIDITVHQNRAEGLVELHSPSGGAWGSHYINKRFEILLETLFGTEFKNTSDWHQVMDYFESAKVSFSPDEPAGRVCVTPINPNDGIDEALESVIKAYNQEHGLNLKIEKRRQMLDFSSFLQKYLQELTSNIVAHVSGLLAKAALQHVKFLFLVGGFAESSILRNGILEHFGDKLRVVIPPHPGVCVLSGAVRFGMNPTVIKERIVTHSIGLQHSVVWDEAKHSGRWMTLGDKGQRYCTDVVRCFVHAGEKIPIRYQVVERASPTLATQTGIKVRLFYSDKSDISFINDEGTKILGYLYLDVPDVGTPTREVEIKMQFGGTTTSVQATYTKTGASVNAKFDFHLDDTTVLLNSMRL